MANPNVIEIRDLCYRVGNRYLINHVNFEVKKGDRWLIFGLNGSGKTTLLSIIAGFQSYTSGTVQVLDHCFTEKNLFELRKKIGFVSHSFFSKYYKNETAMEVVLAGLFGHFGLESDIRSKDIAEARAILKELDILEKKDQPFCSLSKGEQQDILIARAFICKPKILLLDEPCTGLDIYARERMMHVFEDLSRSDDVTIIYVTHYLEEIKPYLDKAALLKYGRFVTFGNAEKVLNDVNLSKLISHDVKLHQCTGGPLYTKITTASNLVSLCYGGERECQEQEI